MGPLRRISALVLSFAFCANAGAQWPFGTPKPALPSANASPAADQPPRDIPLVEKKWGELMPASRTISTIGGQAIAIETAKWKHAETENFVIHYRRVTEAQKVAREVEYDLWFVANHLGAKKEQYEKRSHVFVFQDEAEWKKFLGGTSMPSWSASFANGDDLFLNVRQADAGGQFDSHLLAHETTHAVVARIYPRQRWPIWLSASSTASSTRPVRKCGRT